MQRPVRNELVLFKKPTDSLSNTLYVLTYRPSLLTCRLYCCCCCFVFLFSESAVDIFCFLGGKKGRTLKEGEKERRKGRKKAGCCWSSHPNFYSPFSRIALVFLSVCSRTIVDRIYYDRIALKNWTDYDEFGSLDQILLAGWLAGWLAG